MWLIQLKRKDYCHYSIMAQEKDACFNMFYDTFRELRIDFSLLDISHGMYKDEKFIKDMVTNKKCLVDLETMSLIEECISMVISKLSTKFKDPKSFTLSI